MYPEGNLFIPAPHGRLEAIYRPRREGAARVALVLHPHPQFGGTMHNKVVYRAARALEAAGVEALRFNYRGVGLSTGEWDEGRGELEDARLALDYLLGVSPAAREVIVAGFSFGAAIGMRLGCADQRVDRLIAIGTSTRVIDLSFLATCVKPKLFVHGERDEIAPLAALRAALAQAGITDDPIVIPGAGHFFDAQLPQMMEAISNWVAG